MTRTGTLLLLAAFALVPSGAPQAQCIPATRPLDNALPLHRGVGADPASCRAADSLRLFVPEFLLSTRSGVPDGRGNAGVPTGLGSTLALRAGAEVRWRWVHLRLAPELTQTDNDDFLTFATGDTARSGYASPFYFGDVSADLPSRHGSRKITRIALGESGLWLVTPQRRAGIAASVGATTALPHWGPSFGEGLVLGRSTDGLPRLELRADYDGRDAWLGGHLALAWFGGAAVESRFFDRDPDNDLRGVAGLRLEYRRAHWRVGVARTLMDGRRDRAPLAAAFRPFARGSDAARDSTLDMLSADLELHWPAVGASVWLEAARQAPLHALRDLLLLPAEGLALRIGASLPLLQREDLRWQVGFEALRTDQPPQRADRVDQDLYTSPTVVHGWTHHGEPLGSGVGPGGQRQLISVDRETPDWSVGGFVERIRWNDDALYRVFLPYPLRHDVTLQGGLRAAREIGGWRYGVTFAGGQRLNYLFQNAQWIPGYRTDDVSFFQVGFSVGPARW